MEDVELIIKIPEEIYKASQILDIAYEDTVQIPLEVIKNGIPLDDVIDEVLEYIDDLDIASEICNIFDKCSSERDE